MDDSAPSASLAPTLLVSMPQLIDPNFRRTVVLLCQHTNDGAFGLVLNRPTGRKAADVIDVEPPLAGESSLEVWVGGPVETERGCLLLGEEPDDADSVKICDGVFLSTSPALLRRLAEGSAPRRSRLLIGYAGWGPGQLDQEITQSAWLTADVEVDIVFDIKAEAMWETVIRRLGADPSLLQMSPGVH
jgi:putative transcriptional regulator